MLDLVHMFHICFMLENLIIVIHYQFLLKIKLYILIIKINIMFLIGVVVKNISYYHLYNEILI